MAAKGSVRGRDRLQVEADDAVTSSSMEDLSLIPEGNFWDIGGYKPVLRRINLGPRRCDELVKMLAERCVCARALPSQQPGGRGRRVREREREAACVCVCE
jgi:hypothetical protein